MCIISSWDIVPPPTAFPLPFGGTELGFMLAELVMSYTSSMAFPETVFGVLGPDDKFECFVDDVGDANLYGLNGAATDCCWFDCCDNSLLLLFPYGLSQKPFPCGIEYIDEYLSARRRTNSKI